MTPTEKSPASFDLRGFGGILTWILDMKTDVFIKADSLYNKIKSVRDSLQEWQLAKTMASDKIRYYSPSTSRDLPLNKDLADTIKQLHIDALTIQLETLENEFNEL